MIAWAALDPVTGELSHERGDEIFAAASTIKLFIASAFWRSRLDPDELISSVPSAGSPGIAEYLSPRAQLTLGDLALVMLAVSDNAATNVLLDRLGFDAVNAEIARLGLERTVVRRPMMSNGPENLTCATDLVRGLAAVADARIRGALGLSIDTQLPYHLPGNVRVGNVRVYAKTGELATVYHEVAVLDDGDRSLVTAVCSSSPPARPDEVASVAARLWRERGD